jgi:tetratricopeptide (TPR) repeat protein
MKAFALLGVALCCVLCCAANAEKPRGYTAHPIEAGADYSQRARDAYAAGVWTLEEVEGEHATEPVDAASLQRAYERALQAFNEAVAAEPKMYEALTHVGYCERKLGRYDASLQAYAAALKHKPDYVYAIEYEGEAYLGRGNFERARFNYLRLYALDQSLAEKLLNAMRTWAQDPQRTDASVARHWIEAQAH